MTIPKELQELRSNVETLTKKYKEIKAMPMPEDDDKMEEMMDKRMRETEDMMFRLVGYVHERISYLEDGFYSYADVHGKGHLPAIMGAGKMEKCLKTMGLDEDYQVMKPMIAAASEKYGFELDK